MMSGVVRRRVRAFVRALVRGRSLDREMDEEMRLHVEMEAEDLAREGVAPADARRRAALAFGAADRYREEGREVRGLAWVRHAMGDAAYALRALRRAPVFAVVAVLALGLAIGANAVVFGFVDAAAFRPLPVEDPGELYALYATDDDGSYGEIAYPVWRDVRAGTRGFEDVAAFVEQPISVGDARGADVEWSAMVSPNYFDVIGARALHGRLIGAADEREPVVVLGHAVWLRRFGGDPGVVGRTIRLNGYPWTVIGVLPERFTGTRLFSFAPGLWMSAGMHEQVRPGSAGLLESRPASWFQLIGRLEDGATVAQASASANGVARRLALEYPDVHRDLRFALVSNRTPINVWLASPSTIRNVGVLALIGVGLVLLIACADIANLLLARMTTRRREIAIRLSLGASRARLLRQFLTESIVLALLGCVAAVPLAMLALSAGDALQPPLDYATAFTPAFDARVLLFAAAIAVLSAVVFGLAPTLHALKPGVASALRAEGAGTTGARGRLRDALVVVQIALSVLVLVSAGLFARGLDRAREIDPGFIVDDALVFTLDPQLTRDYDPARTQLVYDELMRRLRALPGVTAVATTSGVPLDGSGSAMSAFAEGAVADDEGVGIDYRIVGGDYLAAFGMQLLEGRTFRAQDAERDVVPAIINTVLAERLWPGLSPLGRRLRMNRPDGTVAEVIGVMPANKWRSLTEPPRGAMLLSSLHSDWSRMAVVVRGTGDPRARFDAVREAIRAVDPTLPVVGMKTLREHIAVSWAAAESGAFSATGFGLLALILAAAGIYGVLSYIVAQRAREFGVRMALGARGTQVVGLVLRRAAALAALGIVIGVLAALPLTRSLGGMLYGVSTRDPFVFGGVAALLGGTALIAAAVPAWRATRVDPMRALRLD